MGQNFWNFARNLLLLFKRLAYVFPLFVFLLAG